MTAAGLKSAIRTQLDADFGTPQDASRADNLALAIATAVVNYLTSNLTVTVAGSQFTAPGGGGPCSGSGTGVIS